MNTFGTNSANKISRVTKNTKTRLSIIAFFVLIAVFSTAVFSANTSASSLDKFFENNLPAPIASGLSGISHAAYSTYSTVSAAITTTATVSTDKADYAPGETAVITGSGFQAGEKVILQVVHINGTAEHIEDEHEHTHTDGEGHEPWDVTADANGGFSTSWYVHPDDSLGATFLLTAKGETSKLTAKHVFTDGNVKVFAESDVSTTEATVDIVKYASTNCTGTPLPAGGGGSRYGEKFSNKNAESAGVGSGTNSIRFTASQTANSGAKQFYHWRSDKDTFKYINENGTPATFNTTSICYADASTNNHVFYANYGTKLPTATTLAVKPATGPFGGRVTLTATSTAGGQPASGQRVNFFFVNGNIDKPVGSMVTNADGVATITNVALIDANGANIPAGTYANYIKAVSEDNADFYRSESKSTLEVTSAPTATATATNGGGVYSGSPYTGSGTCSNNLTPVITYSGGSAPVNAGTTSFTVTCGDGGVNYNNGTAEGSITISPRAITVTANAQSKTFGAADPALTYTGTLLGSDAFTGSLTRAPGDDAGTYAIGQGTLSAGDNYDLTFVGANLVINKADGVCSTPISGYTGVYDGAAHGATGVCTGGTLDLGALFTNVPGGTATWTFTGDKNHNDASGSVKIVINKAAVTVTADAKSKNFGDVDPALTYNTNGSLVGSDAFTGALTRDVGESVGTNSVGTYAIKQGTLALNGNYALTFVGANLIITNHAPSITNITASSYLAPLNTAINFSATFLDVDQRDTHTAVWSWGDSVSCITQSCAGAITTKFGREVTGSHKYTVPGVYTVTLTVRDFSGLSDTMSIVNYIVIYDPNGGFVTGGGWINSPAGASTQYPGAVGKANFGFVSKYQKGATVPTGETEFQFKAGNLNFNSTSYEWLTIAGARAQYKGAGTINGVAGYKFMLTAIDGQVSGGGGADKFRIKIMDASGLTVYDNQMDVPDDGTPTTVIGGGSIVIHSK